jgi:hypothetical protein
MNLAPRELPEDDYRWSVQVLLAVDCLLNALLRGWHHETLSSRAWRAWVYGRPFGRITRPLIDLLFVWQTWRLDHCQRHYTEEVERAALIVKVRSK